MLDNRRRGGGMTTYHHTKAFVLQLINLFCLSSTEFGDGQAIFELWTNKGGVNTGTKQEGETLTVNTDHVEDTH
ncbi:hypothetical protein G6F56_014405 [Rhizopus delemar]|nr:hypothetical protein G6F56_014405 [Rhizopus delemar]